MLSKSVTVESGGSRGKTQTMAILTLATIVPDWWDGTVSADMEIYGISALCAFKNVRKAFYSHFVL